MLLACSLTGFAQDGYTGTPYNGPHNVPGIVQAEDFDEGGEGVAYHDNELGHYVSGRVNPYRPESDVEIESNIISGGYYIANTMTGEWLKYTISAETAGIYDFVFTWAATSSNTAITLAVNGTEIGAYIVPATGSYDAFADFTAPAIPLAAGNNVITIFLSHGNFDKFKVKPSGYTGVAYNGPHTIPGIVQAEEFDEGGEGLAYHDKEPGHEGGGTIYLRPSEGVEIEQGPAGGYHVGWTNAGEWLNYTVNAPAPGEYSLIFSWAVPEDNKTISVDVDGMNLGTYKIPNTGSFDNYSTFVVPGVPISKGDNVITVHLEKGNFDKFEVVRYAGVPFTDYEGSNGEAQVVPGLLEAEYFDDGGEAVAYHSSDPAAGGENNSIRKTEVLPIRYDDFVGDYVIFKDKDWAVYTFNVQKTEGYIVSFTTAGTGTGTLTISLNSTYVGPISVTSTDGEWNFDLGIPLLNLEEGNNYIKLVYEGEGEFKLADISLYNRNVNLVPTYLYEFEDANDLAAPTIGNTPIEFHTIFSEVTPDASGIQSVAGPKENDKAIYIEPNSFFTVVNPVGPSANNDKRLDVFTLLWDVRLIEMNGYNSFVQLRNRTSDGEIFSKSANSGGVIGVTALGYSDNIPGHTIKLGEWARLVFISDGTVKKIYLNGIEIRNTTNTDPRFTIGDVFWIFADNDGERQPLDCSKFAFWAGSALTDVDLVKAGYGGNPTSIQKVGDSAAGKVYAENGKLHVEGHSASASVEVYNLVGQKIAAVKSLNGKTVDVSKGLYIVKVTDKGKSVSYKVIVK